METSHQFYRIIWLINVNPSHNILTNSVELYLEICLKPFQGLAGQESRCSGQFNVIFPSMIFE